MTKLLFIILSVGVGSVFAAEVQNQIMKDHIINLIDSAHPMYRYFSDPSQDSYRLNSLIENNPDLYISDPVFANTLLLKAIEHYLNNIVERLIKANIELNTPGKDGKTPLMVAAQRGNGEAINLLMAHGANPYLQNEQDGLKTAGEYANGDSKKVFEKALKKQKIQRNLYQQQEAPVKTELQKYLPKDLSSMVKEYTYSDDYADYLDLTKNTKELMQNNKKNKKENCIVQ